MGVSRPLNRPRPVAFAGPGPLKAKTLLLLELLQNDVHPLRYAGRRVRAYTRERFPPRVKPAFCAVPAKWIPFFCFVSAYHAYAHGSRPPSRIPAPPSAFCTQSVRKMALMGLPPDLLRALGFSRVGLRDGVPVFGTDIKKGGGLVAQPPSFMLFSCFPYPGCLNYRIRSL